MRKVIVRGTCDKDVATEAREVARSLGIAFSGLLERALDAYMRELRSNRRLMCDLQGKVKATNEMHKNQRRA